MSRQAYSRVFSFLRVTSTRVKFLHTTLPTNHAPQPLPLHPRFTMMTHPKPEELAEMQQYEHEELQKAILRSDGFSPPMKSGEEVVIDGSESEEEVREGEEKKGRGAALTSVATVEVVVEEKLVKSCGEMGSPTIAASAVSETTTPTVQGNDTERVATRMRLKRKIISPDVIELSDEEEEEHEVKRARVASPAVIIPAAPMLKEETKPTRTKTPLTAEGNLDLKALAVERRERLQRKREEAENAKASANCITPSNFYSGAASKPMTRCISGDTGSNTIRLDDANSQPAPPQKISLPYPEGRVFRTHCTGLRRTGDDIQINELLAPNLLQRAVLSAFQWDYHWIISKLPLQKNPNLLLTLVMQGKEPIEREMMQQMFNGTPRVKLVFPNMEGQINCMHSKLMLLWMKRPKNTVGGSDGEEFLRIVVPTANLTDFDWGEAGGFMENMVFVIDLPKRSDPDLAFDQTFFHTELTRFCSHQGIEDSTLTEVSYYDFSATRNMAFIHSIGGSHTGDAWDTTGITGLARAVRTLNLSSSNGLEIDYVTSSLGALKDQFLGDLYRACQGHSGLSDLLRRQKKPPATLTSLLSTTTPPPPQEEETDSTRIRQRFNVYFPSRDTVIRSKNGVNGGGTICFQEQWWNAPGMPKDVLRDCVSKREGVLMHNKILYARLPRELVLPSSPLSSSSPSSSSYSTSTPENPKKTYAAWVYVGSSNLSESAWGKLVLDRSTKLPKLNVRNWECGVLFPIEMPKSKGRTLGGDEVMVGMPMELEKVVEGRVPVPMKVPAGRVERPWFWSEMRR